MNLNQPKHIEETVEIPNLAEWKYETAKRLRGEAEKLKKYGKIGQYVRVVGRETNGTIIGRIIAIESNLPFDDDTIIGWEYRDQIKDKVSAAEGMPISKIKILTNLDNDRKRYTIANLTASEWEPCDKTLK